MNKPNLTSQRISKKIYLRAINFHMNKIPKSLELFACWYKCLKLTIRKMRNGCFLEEARYLVKEIRYEMSNMF